MSHNDNIFHATESSNGDAAPSGRAERLENLRAVLKGICASVDIQQIGPNRFKVTAPLEFIPQLVKATDIESISGRTIDFFEHWPRLDTE